MTTEIELDDTCPVSISSLVSESAAVAPYETPLVWNFEVNVEREMTRSFEVVFSLMSLEAGKEDLVLDEFEIDPLPAGKSEFELEHDMPKLSDIGDDNLIASHGISIRFKYNGKFCAFRAAEVVVGFKDPKMEQELPDEFEPSMLTRRCLGIHGAPKRPAPATSVGIIRPREE